MTDQDRYVEVVRSHLRANGGWNTNDWREVATLLVRKYDAALARADQLEKALREFEKHGLRCDMHPTMRLTDVSTLYSDFARYLARADEGVRSRAATALAGVPAEPATEEKP